MATSPPLPVCPQCGDTGWQRLSVDNEPARVVRCECRAAQRALELPELARIPARYRHCLLENYEAPAGARELQLAQGQAAAYARDYPGLLDRERPPGLLFFGSVGSGKTHLAVGILQRLLERGIACRFADCRELLKQIQATYDPANPATEAGVVAPLLQIEVLLLDDLGVGRATEWALETLHYILNYRYSHQLPTLITTNLEDGEPRSTRLGDGSEYRAGPSLVQGVGERLRSRLYEMCVFVAMHGEDYRRTQAVPVVR